MSDKSTKKKRGSGRPKKKVPKVEMAKAKEYAFRGLKNGTICTLIGWGHNFIEDRLDIRKKLTKKRAERKLWLRQVQDKHAVDTPTMTIFLGKNELGQTDRKDVTSGGKPVKPGNVVIRVDGKDMEELGLTIEDLRPKTH